MKADAHALCHIPAFMKSDKFKYCRVQLGNSVHRFYDWSPKLVCIMSRTSMGRAATRTKERARHLDVGCAEQAMAFDAGEVRRRVTMRGKTPGMTTEGTQCRLVA